VASSKKAEVLVSSYHKVRQSSRFIAVIFWIHLAGFFFPLGFFLPRQMNIH